MSEENRLQTEEDLWDVLSEPVTTESKSKPAPKPKAKPVPKGEGRFARPEPAGAPKDAPVMTAPAKEGRKFDGFFFACMAGVAAVSVAATLVIGSLTGPDPSAGPAGTNPPAAIPGETILTSQEDQTHITQLELENAELLAKVELQKQQIKDLQAKLIDLTGSEELLATAPTGSGGDTTVLDEQVEAYDIFNQIREAYADFDRARLEELIPEMDKRLSQLSSEALNEYYLILEYVEQPSNG